MSRRLPRPPAPPWCEPWLASFELYLKSRGRAPKTRDMYLSATRWLAGWLARDHPEVTDFNMVTHLHLQAFYVHLAEECGCEQAGANATARSIQAFFKWWATEEEAPNPVDKAKPPPAPKPGSKLVPVIAQDQMDALLKDAEKGKDFESRRDAAMIRLFGATGGRISELVLNVDEVNLADRRVRVTGKGGKQRIIPFGHHTALALDRYVRVRAKHPFAHLPALWLGVRRKHGMTHWGLRQVLQRRATRLGITLWPHMFRHTFCSEWLDRGGNESDLMELTGWESTQMLKVYGREARGRRAARAYDRVMGEAV